jgi:hypothetical protein
MRLRWQLSGLSFAKHIRNDRANINSDSPKGLVEVRMLGILPIKPLAHGWHTTFLSYSSDYVVLAQARTASSPAADCMFVLSDPSNKN